MLKNLHPVLTKNPSFCCLQKACSFKQKIGPLKVIFKFLPLSLPHLSERFKIFFFTPGVLPPQKYLGSIYYGNNK